MTLNIKFSVFFLLDYLENEFELTFKLLIK